MHYFVCFAGSDRGCFYCPLHFRMLGSSVSCHTSLKECENVRILFDASYLGSSLTLVESIYAISDG